MSHRPKLIAATLALAAAAGFARGQAALTPMFTYQGELRASGAPSTGNFDLQFKLFNALSAGTQVGATQTASPVTVAQGRFTVPLNFGAAAFDGTRRWLEISVKGPGALSYTTLSPRQEITAAPYALTADRLALPFSATASTDAPLIPTGLLHIAQTGTAHGIMATSSSTGAAFYGLATGLGDALRVHSYGGPSSGSAVHASSDDYRAGTFEITNPSSPHIALYAMTNGSGHAIQGHTNGTGRGVGGYNNGTSGNAGYFRIGSNANGSDALYAETQGDGRAVHAWAAGGGTAVYARSNGGAALEIGDGDIKIKGAGAGTATPVFIHVVTSASLACANGFCHRSTIDNPMTNGDPNALVFAIPVQTGQYIGPSVGVTYENGKWHLTVTGEWQLADGYHYNVLVFKR